MTRRLELTALFLLALGCGRQQERQQPTATPVVSAPPAVSTSPAAVAASAPAAAPPSAAAPAAAPLEHCKALGKKGALLLATTQESMPRLDVEGDTLFVYGYTHELARTSLHLVSRAGGKLTAVASFKGLGELTGATLSHGALYYTQRGSLVKLGPVVDAALELRKGADSAPAVFGDRAFIVECDRKGPDKLLELPIQGGEATLLAELPHTSTEKCNYPSVVADAADVFVADWRGSRVVAVSRSDKAVRDLVTKKGFPSNLLLDGTDLVLLGALGLLRVPRAGGDIKKLFDAERFGAPWSSVLVSGDEYWLTDQLAYATTSSLFRMPRATTTLRTVTSYHVKDPVGPAEKGDSGLRSFAVDDECVYTAEWYGDKPSSQLLARAK